jgi:hypothetical protein
MKKMYVLIDLSNESIEFYKNTIFDFAKELKKITILDISKLAKKKAKIKHINRKYNLNIIQPKNFIEFEEILKSKNTYYLYAINNGFENFYINYLISKYNIKKFIVSNIGYNPENYNYYKKNIIQKIIIFNRIRLKYYIFRFFVLINIFPKIDYFFEASDFIYKSIINGLSFKLQKKIPLLNISYYKKVFKINSRSYDNIYYSRFKISEKYIVFLDGMLFDHKDRILRDGYINKISRKEYYDKLYKILKKYEKIFKKKIIVCLHPKNNISGKRRDFKDLKCIKFQTEKYMSQAFIIFFHEGSSIIQGIVQKKKIINLHGKILGNYANKRCDIYPNLLKLYRIDLNNIVFKKRANLLKILEMAKKNYNSYIKKNIVKEPNKSSIIQIINYLKLK